MQGDIRDPKTQLLPPVRGPYVPEMMRSRDRFLSYFILYLTYFNKDVSSSDYTASVNSFIHSFRSLSYDRSVSSSKASSSHSVI
jgi:hypothetical protein